MLEYFRKSKIQILEHHNLKLRLNKISFFTLA